MSFYNWIIGFVDIGDVIYIGVIRFLAVSGDILIRKLGNDGLDETPVNWGHNSFENHIQRSYQ